MCYFILKRNLIFLVYEQMEMKAFRRGNLLFFKIGNLNKMFIIGDLNNSTVIILTEMKNC